MPQRSIYARLAWPIVLFMVATFPAWLWGTIKSRDQMNNHVSQWLPRDFPATETYWRFRELFGQDDVAAVSWDGCTLDDPRLEVFAEAVRPDSPEKSPYQVELFRRVVTGRGLVEQLTSPPMQLPREQAIRRLQGAVIGPDGKQTCALVTLSPKGGIERRAAVETLVKIAKQECGLTSDQLHLSGGVVGNAAIDIESERAMTQWRWISIAVGVLVAVFCLQSFQLLVMVFSVSIYAAFLIPALVYFTGQPMNLILVVVPALIFVLTLSAAVHVSHYYVHAIRRHGLVGAPMRAVRDGWAPCAISAITTAVGLVSLCLSHIVPVQQFGAFAALGMVVSLGVIFGGLPAMMELWPRSTPPRPARGGKQRDAEPSDDTDDVVPGEGRLTTLARAIIRRRGVISVAGILLLVFCGAGTVWIQTSAITQSFFPEDSRWAQDFRWFSENVAPTRTVELMVRFDAEVGPSVLEQLRTVRRIHDHLDSMEQTRGVLSAATFAPHPPTVEGKLSLREIIAQKTYESNFRAAMPSLEESGYLAQLDAGRVWRISARLPNLRDTDPEVVLETVRTETDAMIANGQWSGQETLTIDYTGTAPLVSVAQEELLDGLFRSFLAAFGLITLVMIWLLRSFSAGGLIMLPNLFPALVTFGLMGWWGLTVDIGSMMTASVALGIAIDDTLHYLTWFQRSLRAGRPRDQAISDAFVRCAPAMTHTSLIAGLALLVFIFCGFQPIARFGLLMFILLFGALVGDLLFLPALLSSPAGRVFEKQTLE